MVSGSASYLKPKMLLGFGLIGIVMALMVSDFGYAGGWLMHTLTP